MSGRRATSGARLLGPPAILRSCWSRDGPTSVRDENRAVDEGTFTQANRRADLSHARYLGLAKTHLQNVITVVALNLLWLPARLGEVQRATTRTSPSAHRAASGTRSISSVKVAMVRDGAGSGMVPRKRQVGIPAAWPARMSRSRSPITSASAATIP